MDMINIKKLYHSLLKVIREERITGKARLVLAGAALGTGLLFSGCEEQIVTPDGQVATVTVDDQNKVSVTIDDQQQTPDTQDPVDNPEPEVVEELPQIIIYNEDGTLYEAQKVTLDDFYAKVEKDEEEFNFKNDWERDRHVALLLWYNNYYMEKEDVVTIYKDYLVDFGYNVVRNECSGYYSNVFNKQVYDKKSFGTYFIDPKLSHEVDLLEEYYKKNGEKALCNLIEEKTSEIDTYDKNMFNSFTYDLGSLVHCDNLSDDNSVKKFFYDDNAIIENSYNLYNIMSEEDLTYNVDNYKKDEYVSSHNENVNVK